MTLTVFEVKVNSDSTEGRGSMVTQSYHATLEEALEGAKGRGVMGYGDGDVYQVEVYTTRKEIAAHQRLIASSTQITGHRRTPDGKWGHGFLDNRDFVEDPEWKEFLRLSQKFKDRR